MAMVEKEFTEMERRYWNSVPMNDLDTDVLEHGYTGLVIQNGMIYGYEKGAVDGTL